MIKINLLNFLLPFILNLMGNPNFYFSMLCYAKTFKLNFLIVVQILNKYNMTFSCNTNLIIANDEKMKEFIYKSLPEAMTSDIITKENFSISSEIKKYKVIGIGPGLGMSKLAIKNFNFSRNRRTIFIFGGSQGSRFLNQSLSKIMMV